jgi:site-specific DNA-methyltransferase (adenine-specific)
MKKVCGKNWEMWLADCTDVLPMLENVDAVVSDVPYGMKADFERKGLRTSRLLGGYDFKQEYRFTTIAGDDETFKPAHLLGFDYVALFGANHFSHLLPAEVPGKQYKWLFWDKRCGTPSDDNSDGELIWTNQYGALRTHRQKWRGIVREGEENLSIQGAKLHPAQKPVALMKWILEQIKVPLDSTVLDPYCGVASTGVACLRTGRKFIGIEKDENYFAIAVERLQREEEKQESSLFASIETVKYSHYAESNLNLFTQEFGLEVVE